MHLLGSCRTHKLRGAAFFEASLSSASLGMFYPENKSVPFSFPLSFPQPKLLVLRLSEGLGCVHWSGSQLILAASYSTRSLGGRSLPR